MAATASTMLPLGTEAPAFSLPDPNGKLWSLADFEAAPALLVAFLSNHCPFVKHVADGLGVLARDLAAEGVPVIGIGSNDTAAYPDDAPEHSAAMAARHGWAFPYLADGSQATARAYRAACTPDFYVFDQHRTLVYRGQMDGARPGNNVAVSGADLRAAVDALLAGQPVPADQRPSVGCSIKWKPGNAPEYF